MLDDRATYTTALRLLPLIMPALRCALSASDAGRRRGPIFLLAGPMPARFMRRRCFSPPLELPFITGWPRATLLNRR